MVHTHGPYVYTIIVCTIYMTCQSKNRKAPGSQTYALRYVKIIFGPVSKASPMSICFPVSHNMPFSRSTSRFFSGCPSTSHPTNHRRQPPDHATKRAECPATATYHNNMLKEIKSRAKIAGVRLNKSRSGQCLVFTLVKFIS